MSGGAVSGGAVARAALTAGRRRAGRRAASVVAALVAVTVALAGCAPAGQTAPDGPRFVLSHNPSPVWQPVGIKVTALPPGQRVSIRATVRDGAVWSSRADYLVPASGTVDLDSQAPVDAPFSGVDGMGLFWSMRSASGAPATSGETWGASTLRVRLTAVVGGRRVADTSVVRVGLASASVSRAVFDDGISGDFFQPTSEGKALRPAIIVFDGTDSGTSIGVIAASQLAANGYPALALSTFGSAGQLDPTHTFPAERFLSAVAWLRSQPGVDRQRIFTFGTSRGAQLALWTAVAYPSLVYGAIAPAGTTGLVCNSPVPNPLVTVGGSWVPCAAGTRDTSAPNVLDLSRIPGPIVLGCAGRDEQLDNGCTWMAAGITARGHRIGDVFVHAPQATHLFYAPPYTPLYLPAAPYAQPTEDARVRLWNGILEALSEPSSVPGH